MRYWRDPDTGDVIKSNADATADPGDVIVIPEADWRRLTLLVARGHEGPFSGMTGHEIDSIIQRTEEANDA